MEVLETNSEKILERERGVKGSRKKEKGKVWRMSRDKKNRRAKWRRKREEDRENNGWKIF